MAISQCFYELLICQVFSRNQSFYNLYQAAKRAHVLEPHLIEQLKVDLEAIVPMKAVLNPDYIASN